ncbi:MAG: hypothetical protein ABIH76_05250 [Candidatus Bathyarchaeota archaeon]
MKKIGTATFLLLLILGVIAVAPLTSVEAQQESNPVSVDQATHRIQIQDTGVVLTNDTFTVRNAGSSTFSDFEILAPEQLSLKLFHIAASDSFGRDLEIVTDTDLNAQDFIAYRVKFSQDIGIGESYTFSVFYWYFGLITLVPGTANTFNVTFPQFPSLTQAVSSVYVTIIFPEETLPGASNAENYGSGTFNVHEHSLALTWVTVSGVFQIFEVLNASREVSVNYLNEVTTKDTFEFRNLATTINPIAGDFIRIQNANNIEQITDGIGPIEFSTEAETLKVKPRFSLRYNAIYTITVEYRTQSLLSQEGETFHLNFPFISETSWPIKKLSVRASLPEGTSNIVSSPEPDIVREDGLRKDVFYIFYDVSEFNLARVDVKFERSPIWTTLYPILWVGILVAVFVPIVVFYRLRKRIKVEKVRKIETGTVAPPPPPSHLPETELLRSFIETCDERMRLLTWLIELDEKRRSGTMPKAEYRMKKRDAEEKLGFSDRDAANIKLKMRELGATYSDIVTRVDEAEAQLSTNREKMRTIESDFRGRTIHKDLYEELHKECVRKIRDAQSRIQENLKGLQ